MTASKKADSNRALCFIAWNLPIPRTPLHKESKEPSLYAVIDTDGTVKTLQSLDGPPALISAALAAVRQWRYSPSLLDGHPVQTERQIKIVFQLSQSQ